MKLLNHSNPFTSYHFTTLRFKKPVLGHVLRHVLEHVGGHLLWQVAKQVTDWQVLARHVAGHVLGKLGSQQLSHPNSMQTPRACFQLA